MLRKLFGPSQDEIWGQLATQIGGTFVDGGTWNADKVVAQTEAWTVTLDTYTVSTGKSSVTYTRLRAPYHNADDFRFNIYRAGMFSGIGRALGMQDIEIGYPGFDRDYVIKSNNPHKVRELFAYEPIRKLLREQPEVHFEVKDDEGWFGKKFPEGVDELSFHAYGVIKDVERLKGLFALFAATLHRLTQIGAAYEDEPQVDL